MSTNTTNKNEYEPGSEPIIEVETSAADASFQGGEKISPVKISSVPSPPMIPMVPANKKMIGGNKVTESPDSISGKITVTRIKIKRLADDIARDTAVLKELQRKLKKLEKLNDQFNNL